MRVAGKSRSTSSGSGMIVTKAAVPDLYKMRNLALMVTLANLTLRQMATSAVLQFEGRKTSDSPA